MSDVFFILWQAEFGKDSLIGQAASLFVAGFDPSATTLTFTLYELALQPNIQSRLREELTSAIANNGGAFTYEMVRLHACFYENQALFDLLDDNLTLATGNEPPVLGYGGLGDTPEVSSIIVLGPSYSL